MEVVDIKKNLVPNLLIYTYLHCVRSSSWCATMLATLTTGSTMAKFDKDIFIIEILHPSIPHPTVYFITICHGWPCSLIIWISWIEYCKKNLQIQLKSSWARGHHVKKLYLIKYSSLISAESGDFFTIFNPAWDVIFEIFHWYESLILSKILIGKIARKKI